MMSFKQYTIADFFEKHYYQGGLSYSQIQAMFEHCTKERYNDYRFFAGIQGIDLDKHTGKQSSQASLDEQQKKQSLPLFRDPSYYDDLSAEEREKLTQEMMNKHRRWVRGKSKIVGS